MASSFVGKTKPRLEEVAHVGVEGLDAAEAKGVDGCEVEVVKRQTL